MAQVPSGQKFHTVPPNVETKELGSKLSNSQREIYTMQDIIDTARPYKVFSALLTQSGEDDPLSIDTGLLTIGVTYMINNSNIGMDFTNVGAPNNDINTYFIATGTTPNSWGTGGETNILNYNAGAPVATVIENTTGLNTWFRYIDTGNYVVDFSEIITDRNIFVFINGGNYTNNPLTLVKSNFTYEENAVVINSFNDGSLSNDVLSDPDNYYKTSLEIRIYN